MRGGPGGLSADNVVPVLERAFASRRCQGVVLVINSPGGSAVQSHLIASRTTELAKLTGKPTTAFVEDIAASGGYMMALGADEIVANPFSVVGSIGAIYSGFGFVETIAKLGVERRVIASAEHKAQMDPFRSMSERDAAKMKHTLDSVHTNFAAYVKARRGSRLKAGADDTIFSGDIWTAREAQDLGLVDDVATSWRELVDKRYGARIVAFEFRPRPSLFRLAARDVGTDFAEGVAAAASPRVELR